MLVHLSKTSPYLCDLSLGPIEQANRMASAPTKRVLPFLELKDSFPKLTRTPLKLLAHDEVPMDSSIATTTTDINTSRQQSLQPVWYTEQSIIDDNHDQQTSPSHHRFNLTRSTLPTIESDSPDIEDEIIEQHPLSTLMRKSSTFTIEHQPSIIVHSPLNESEKENDTNVIITSTQQDPINSQHQPDESFRALEHLLGLGSTNTNLTMTTTTHESPKSNHDTLSLTIVTPTELINNTTSLHLSYAPAGAGSLPSSQNILLMPTIESLTDPSINSTIPPPFSVDNSIAEEQSSTGTTEVHPENFHGTDDSFRFTDDDEEEKHETPKDDSSNDDETNFSFELNDFSNSCKDSIDTSVSQPTELPVLPPPMITIRAPTSADVAYRALIKPRTSGRMSQPMKIDSPLAKTDQVTLIPQTSRVLRSSYRRTSEQNVECRVNQQKSNDDYPPIELVQVITVPDEDELQPESAAGITLNLTTPNSAEEADCSASLTDGYLSTPTEPIIPVLSREFTYNTPTTRATRVSERRRSMISNRRSAAHSYVPLVQDPPATIIEEEKESSSDNVSLCSTVSSRKTMLSILSTNPTVISEAPALILQKSLAGSASPSPNPTPIITIRPNECSSSNLSPRRSIHPLHSSTPSVRNQSLQMVSIGEQEQVSTTAPQHLNMDSSEDEHVEFISLADNEQQVDIPIRIQHVSDEGVQTSPERPIRRIDIAVQTTPSLDPSSRRRFHTTEQQTTPVITRSSSSCQTIPVPVVIRRSHIQQTSPTVQSEHQQQSTPLHSKAMMHLRRNVRFQFTPSTDARLAAKDKQEEEERRRVKEEIRIDHFEPTKPMISDNEREEDTEDEVRKHRKTKKKIISVKKKQNPPSIKTDESSEELIESPVLPITRREHSKETTDDDQPKPDHIHSTKKKRSARLEKKPSPIQESPEVIVTTKRVNRKRANPKTSAVPPPDTTSPTEPVPKRAKTIEVKQPVRVPSPATRSRSKTPVAPKVNVKPASPPPPPIINLTKKSKKTSGETSPIEIVPVIANNKRKTPTSNMKKGKRRLHSVEQDEGLNTADEEEIVASSLSIDDFKLSQDEREKIEVLTVAELKTRLITHGEQIPKGVRKADLVALLFKIELQLLKERKEAEIVAEAITSNPTSRKTRRKK